MRINNSMSAFQNPYSDPFAGSPGAMFEALLQMLILELVLQNAMEGNVSGALNLLGMLGRLGGGGGSPFMPRSDSFVRGAGGGIQAPRFGAAAPNGTFPAWSLQQAGGAIGSGQVRPMRQGDCGDQLGFGSNTVASHGCFVTSMAMAASVRDPSMTPGRANELLKANGGFDPGTGSLRDADAARALGMEMVDRTDRVDPAALDQNLRSNGPVVAGVDYKDGSSSAISSADHFITITGKNGSGGYSAIDPATGKGLTLEPGSDGVLRGGGYTVTEALYLKVPGWNPRSTEEVDTGGRTGIGGGKPSIDFNGTALTSIEGHAADGRISLSSFKPALRSGAYGVALSNSQAAALGVNLGDQVAVVDRSTGRAVRATYYDNAGSRGLSHMEMSPGLAEHFGIVARSRRGRVLDAVNESAYEGRFEIRRLR